MYITIRENTLAGRGALLMQTFMYPPPPPPPNAYKRRSRFPILPTFDTLIRRSGHYNAWKVSTCSFPKCYGLWTKRVLKFLNLW